MLNKAMLIGNVGKIDIRNAGDSKVATVTLATSERYKSRDGEMVENTTWHNVVVWGKTAEYVEKYVSKGSKLYIEGKIQNRKYIDKDGNERFVTEIRADNIQNLTPKKGDSNGASGSEDLPF